MKSQNITIISERLTRQLAQAKAVNAAWKASGKILKPLVKALGIIDIEPSMDNETCLYVSATGGAKRLEQIVGVLAAYGFSPDSDYGDPTEYMTKWFNHPGTKVRVYFSFSADVCERIQVGTETITRPVYKTVCKGFDEPLSLPAPTLDEDALS